MKEKWTRWEPIENLSKQYYAESISDTFSKGFEIKLIDHLDTNKKILVSWPDSVYAYRKPMKASHRSR